jgi:hypothetical protein
MSDDNDHNYQVDDDSDYSDLDDNIALMNAAFAFGAGTSAARSDDELSRSDDSSAGEEHDYNVEHFRGALDDDDTSLDTRDRYASSDDMSLTKGQIKEPPRRGRRPRRLTMTAAVNNVFRRGGGAATKRQDSDFDEVKLNLHVPTIKASANFAFGEKAHHHHYKKKHHSNEGDDVGEQSVPVPISASHNEPQHHQAPAGPRKRPDTKKLFRMAIRKVTKKRNMGKMGLAGLLSSDEEESSYGSYGSGTSSGGSDGDDFLVDFPTNRQEFLEQREQALKETQAQPLDDSYHGKLKKKEDENYEGDQRKPWRRLSVPIVEPEASLHDSLSSTCFLETGADPTDADPKSFRIPRRNSDIEQQYEKIGFDFENERNHHARDDHKDDDSQLTFDGDENSVLSELLLAQAALGWKEESSKSDRSLLLKEFSCHSGRASSSPRQEETKVFGRRESSMSIGTNMPEELDVTGAGSFSNLGMERVEEVTEDDSEPRRRLPRRRSNSAGSTDADEDGKRPTDKTLKAWASSSDGKGSRLERTQSLFPKADGRPILSKPGIGADPLRSNSDRVVVNKNSSLRRGLEEAEPKPPPKLPLELQTDSKIADVKARIAAKLAASSQNKERMALSDRDKPPRQKQPRSSSLSQQAGKSVLDNGERKPIASADLHKKRSERRRSESDGLLPIASHSTQNEGSKRRSSDVSSTRRPSNNAHLMEMALSTAAVTLDQGNSTLALHYDSDEAVGDGPTVISDDEKPIPQAEKAAAEAEYRRKEIRRKRHHRHRRHNREKERGEDNKAERKHRSKSRHCSKSKRQDGENHEEGDKEKHHRSKSRRKSHHRSKSRRREGEEEGEGDNRLHVSLSRRHRPKEEDDREATNFPSVDGIGPIPGDDKSMRTTEDSKEEEKLNDASPLADESVAIIPNGARASKPPPPQDAQSNAALLAMEIFNNRSEEPHGNFEQKEQDESEDAEDHPAMEMNPAALLAMKMFNKGRPASSRATKDDHVDFDYDAPPSATLEGLNDDEDDEDFKNIKHDDDDEVHGDIEEGNSAMDTSFNSVQLTLPLKGGEVEEENPSSFNPTVIKALANFRSVFKTAQKGEAGQSFYGLWSGRDSSSESLDGSHVEKKKSKSKVKANLKVTLRTTSWGLKMQRIFGPQVWARKWYILGGIIFLILILAISIPLATTGGDKDPASPSFSPIAPTVPSPFSPIAPTASPTILPTKGSSYQEIAEVLGNKAGDNTGTSVSLSADGRYMAVGAPQVAVGPGEVRVYARQSSSNDYVLLGNTIFGAQQGDLFGLSVSISDDGQIVTIGAPSADNNSGYAAIFRFDPLSSTWEQLGNILTSVVPDGRAGSSVSLSGKGRRVAVGIPRANGLNGITLVYQYSPLTQLWTRLGQSITGSDGELNGFAVSLDESGETLAIGAVRSPTPSADRGRVYLLTFSNAGEWQQLGRAITGSDLMGRSISLSSNGRRVAIGSTGYGSGLREDVGACQVFGFVDNNWSQLGSVLAGEQGDERSGFSVALSRNGLRLACGGPGDSVVRLYRSEENDWEQVGNSLEGLPSTDFGAALAMNGEGNVVVVGVPEESVGGQSNIGLVRVFED